MKSKTLLIFFSVLGAVLLAAVASWAEKTEISTYYPYPTTSAAQVRSDNGAIGDAAFRVNTPPTNGLIVQGNVGIGTPSPQGVLDVRRAVDGNLGIFLANNQPPAAGSLNETVTLQFLHGHPSGGNALKTGGHIRSGKESDYTSDANVDSYLAFATALNDADVERMRITSTGNIGIGTTTVASGTRLEVKTPTPDAASDVAISAQVNKGVGINAGATTGRAISAQVSGSGSTAYGIYVTAPNAIAIHADTGNVIVRAGNVGIGEAIPLGRLHVKNTSGTGIIAYGGNWGVEGFGTGVSSVGVHGEGTGKGVYGRSANIAVYGEGTGSTSYGGWFTGGLVGVSAEGPTGVSSKSTTTNGAAVSGLATGTGGVGVSGTATGSGGVGVRGSASAGTTNWDFYAAGGANNYGPFTGAHEVKILPGQQIEKGMIVSVTGEVAKRDNPDGSASLSSTLPTIELSSVANDPAVLGVLAGEGPLVGDHWYPAKPDDRFGAVNALGEGRLWVTDVNGEIKNGDLITSSPVPGYGQRQADDLFHSYTVAKATEQIDWPKIRDTIEYQGKRYKKHLIAVTYHSG